MEARAIVAYANTEGKLGGSFRMEDVSVLPTGANELLVEIVATGICHTDIFFANLPDGLMGGFPRVLGHEGVGWVKAVGEGVTVARPGDAVLLSFASCGSCQACEREHLPYCHNFAGVNYEGPAGYHSSTTGNDLRGHFFGQSSFASLSNVSEKSVVNVSQWIKDEKEMAILAALGCSFQSGSATVTKLAGAGKRDSVVVMGLGGVGMAAIMAAKIQGCHQIIGVDRVESRLKLAKELGATHIINTTSPDMNLVAEVKRLTNGNGSNISIDATGVVPLIKAALEFTANAGKMILIGVPPLDGVLDLHIISFLGSGKTLVGSMEGDAVPSEHVPKMIEWYKAGNFPVDRLIKTYPADEFQTALNDMESGATIKPVLLWK